MEVYTELEMVMELIVINFVTSNNLAVKSTTFPHHNVHKFTWTTPDDNTIKFAIF
jgi:hypothetical protein